MYNKLQILFSTFAFLLDILKLWCLLEKDSKSMHTNHLLLKENRINEWLIHKNYRYDHMCRLFLRKVESGSPKSLYRKTSSPEINHSNNFENFEFTSCIRSLRVVLWFWFLPDLSFWCNAFMTGLKLFHCSGIQEKNAYSQIFL